MPGTVRAFGALLVFGLCLACGCNSGGSSGLSGANTTGPQLVEVQYVVICVDYRECIA